MIQLPRIKSFKIKASIAIMLLYVLFAKDKSFCENGIFTNVSHFYAPSKTIHSQAKFIIMYYCDQEAKKFRRLISSPES